MKYLVSFGIMILLIVFPLVSWYYLDTGLDYRIKLRDATLPKGSIQEFGINQIEVFKSKTSLIQLDPSIDKSIIDNIYQQFKKAETFQLVTPYNYDADNVTTTEGITLLNKRLSGHSFVLIDTSLNVRNVYDNIHDTTLVNLVAQLAVTLPLKKPRDIKQKMPK